MKVEKKSNYTVLISEEKSFLDFYNLLLEIEENNDDKHLVIKISDNLHPVDKDFLLLLGIAEKRKTRGLSFVVIAAKIDIDSLPEALNIVPTLIEAEDIIEMEAIERTLGF